MIGSLGPRPSFAGVGLISDLLKPSRESKAAVNGGPPGGERGMLCRGKGERRKEGEPHNAATSH